MRSPRAEYVGPNQIRASFHVLVRRGTPIEEADGIAEAVQARLRQSINCRYCLVHVDLEEADPEPPPGAVLPSTDDRQEGETGGLTG